MALTPTIDPDVVIEEDIILPDQIDPVSGNVGSRSITYRSISTGRRWQVIGNCDRRGDCMVGGVVNGFIIHTKADLDQAGFKAIEAARTFDTPVTPEFDSCCPFRYIELEN